MPNAEMSADPVASMGGPRVRADLAVRQVDDDLVVLDRRSNQVHRLNRTASFIWLRCNGQRSPKAIANDLVETFGIEREQAVQDAERVLSEFARLRLLEN